MPEPGVSTVVILLAACTGLLFLLLMAALRIGGRLVRIEQVLNRPREDDGGVGEVLAKVPDAGPGGAFEEFLNEDPARRQLTKSEQFAAYRRWRQEKGLNWSNS